MIAHVCIRFGCSAAITCRDFVRVNKFLTRIDFARAIGAKISRLANARAANQSSLIRSFLIDSGWYEPFAKQILKKYFYLCRCRRHARCRSRIECAHAYF
jgi:hypothetical protein